MKSKLLLLTLGLAIFLTNCTERIELDIDQQAYARLVVDGQFTTKEGNNWIRLTKTGDYFDNQPTTPVLGATVIVHTNNNEIIPFVQQGEEGYYLASDEIIGQIGNQYQLKIELEEAIGGESFYESNKEELKSSLPPDSIQLLYKEETQKWIVKAYSWDSTGVDYYLFKVFKNGELLTDSIHEYSVWDDKYFNGNYSTGINVQELDTKKEDSRLKPGDTITLEVGSITESYFQFLKEYQIQLSGSDPMFSGPSANISSNINNGAIGFFSVYSLKSVSTVVPGKIE